MSNVDHVGIAGVGMYVPERRLTNADLEKIVDTSDEWITTRSGIKERHICAPGEAVSDIAVASGRKALAQAGITPEEVGAIICGTFTGDTPVPSTACHIQRKLGAKNAFAFDLAAACTGFVYSLTVGKALILNGICDTALIFGIDALSKFTDYEDRTTCVLFGDGGGAAILRANANQGRIISEYLGADGTLGEFIIVPGGGSLHPATKETVEQRMHYVKMAGNEVFKFAVRILAHSVEKALERSGHTVGDLKLIIPHQANYRIMDAAAKRIGIPREKMYKNIDKYGNTSAGTVPIALAEAVADGSIEKGDLIALVAFGGGMTWGACIIEW